VVGTALADSLTGSARRTNVLQAGAGNDTLTGKAGSDTFVYQA